MSFNINFQKTNKDSLIRDRMVVRRFWTDKETKKKQGTVIYSVSIYRIPDEIPQAKIDQHNVTKDEQELYTKFVQDYKIKEEGDSLPRNLSSIASSMTTLTERLSKRTDGLTEKSLDDFETAYIELKKELTRQKKNLKRRVDREDDAQLDILED